MMTTDEQYQKLRTIWLDRAVAAAIAGHFIRLSLDGRKPCYTPPFKMSEPEVK